MGSQGDAVHSGGTNPSSNWEEETSDPHQTLEQSPREKVDQYLRNITNDENSLSPASKKLLESCAVSMPPPAFTEPSMKSGISVIARPTNMGLDFAGFSFTKPMQPSANFSCRSRSQRSSEVPQETSGDKETLPAQQGIRAATNVYSSVASNQPEKENRGQTSIQPLEAASQPPENVPPGSPSTNTNPSSSKKSGGPSPVDPTPGKSPICSTAKHPDITEHLLHTGSRDHPNNRPVFGNSPRRRTAEEQPNYRQVNETTSRATKESSGPLAVQATPTQPSKVTKRQCKAKSKPPQLPRDNGAPVQSSQSEPSEEDLFYLLIHRLRQREDSEAASAALKERMEAQIHEMARVNEDLQFQLDQARTKSLNQEAEIDSHRGLVNRWKVKLGKIRTFITGIGNDSECLRKEGQAIKSAQETLAGERQVITDSLEHLHHNVSRIEQHRSNHQAQFTGICHDLQSLQQSLSAAEGKVADGKKLLLQEKRRVSTLENFIRGHSTKQQRQVALLEQRQIETTSKLDVFFDHVQKHWGDSQNTLECEVQPGLGECLKLIRILCDRDFLKLSDLESVQGTIGVLTSRLDSHMMHSTTDMEKALKLQNDQCSHLKSQFENFEGLLNSTVSTTGQLVQAREHNAKLEGKLRNLEETLAHATIDCSRYMLAEKDLREKVSNLETDLAAARQQLSCAPLHSSQSTEGKERISQLQTQLEETSVTLADEREALKAKENEISDLREKLSETKDSLEDTMRRMTGVETENSVLQEQIRSVEYRVREELSRASLASRDQNRAWVEQQVHKLKQEKVTAENSAARFQEQLAIVKESLVRAERSKSTFDEQEAEITTLSRQVKELEGIKKSSLKMEKELESFEEQHASILQERALLQQEIEAAKIENEGFLTEIRELRENNVAIESSEKLQKKVSLLENQISKKDSVFAKLMEKLEAASSKAETIPGLEHCIEEKMQETASLKEQVEEANNRCTEAASNFQRMSDDCTMLRKELSSVTQNKADLVELQTKLDHKEQESHALQGRVEEIDHWSRRAQDFLLKSKVLGKKESIFNNWDSIETRLGVVFENRPYQTDVTSDNQVVSSRRETPKRPTHRGVKRSRTSTSSGCPETQEQDGVFRECHTQEMVYFSHNKQERVSGSPQKLLPHTQVAGPSYEQGQCSSNFIKPFSQVQSDIRTQAPSSSPDVSLSDLSSMFPSTPRSENAYPGIQFNNPMLPDDHKPLESRRDPPGNAGQKTARNASRRRKNSDGAKSAGTIDPGHKRKEKRRPDTDSHSHSSPNLKRKASTRNLSDNTQNTQLCASASSRPTDLHGAERVCSPKPRDPEHSCLGNPPANNPPPTSIQKSSRNLLRKGILKDPTSVGKDYQTERRRIEGTPLGGKDKVKTLRKASSSKGPGTTSEYFSHTSSPKSAVNEDGGVFGVNQRSAQSLTHVSREKRRRSSRGNRYNDRFSQGVTRAE